MAASASRVGLRWCDSEVGGLLEICADDSIQSQLDTTLGDDALIVVRRDDLCMKEQSCPGHGLCDHGCDSVTTGQRGEWGGGESS